MSHRLGVSPSGTHDRVEALSAPPIAGLTCSRSGRARSTVRSTSRSTSRSQSPKQEPPLGLVWGTVQIVEHETKWSYLFEEEKKLLMRALGSLALDIQHVGSTAVPGLAAKPIIDIAIGLRTLEQVTALVPKLVALEYELLPEIKIPGEIFFRKHNRVYHLHVLEQNSPDWQNYLFFRDYLRAHPQAAQQYIALKRELAAQFSNDRPSYTRGKAEFIARILQSSRAHDPDPEVGA